MHDFYHYTDYCAKKVKGNKDNIFFKNYQSFIDVKNHPKYICTINNLSTLLGVVVLGVSPQSVVLTL